MKKISEKVPKHQHCPVCGMPISLDRETCSKECEERLKKLKWGRMIPFFLIIMAVLIAAISLSKH